MPQNASGRENEAKGHLDTFRALQRNGGRETMLVLAISVRAQAGSAGFGALPAVGGAERPWNAIPGAEGVDVAPSSSNGAPPTVPLIPVGPRAGASGPVSSVIRAARPRFSGGAADGQD